MNIKKIIFFTLLVFSLACNSNNGEEAGSLKINSAQHEGYKRYGIESAVIEYEITGMRTGTEKLIFDNWGAREAKYENAKLSVSGFTVEDDKLHLTLGEWSFNIDMKTKTGTKIKTPFIDEMAKAAGTNDLAEIGERIMKSMGGKITGQEELLGKTCDVWEIESVGSKSWVWNWVTLKTEIKFMGQNMAVTATKIDVDASVSDSEFEIPADVTITESEGLNSILEKMKGGFQKNKKN